MKRILPITGSFGKSFLRFSSFYFSQVDKNTVLKEIRKLNMSKAVQDKDIPVKILK